MIAIISGTGLGHLFERSIRELFKRPFRQFKLVSGRKVHYTVFDHDEQRIVFLDRHNNSGTFLLPHQLNRQDYMYLLGEVLKVDLILATSAVGAPYKERGGLSQGSLVVPSDAIDYVQDSYTFAKEGLADPLAFHRPTDVLFCPHLKKALGGFVSQDNIRFVLANSIKGPRFETLAEMKVRQRDGVDLVGMPTAFPEAVLAGELSIPYGLLCGVTNLAPAKHNGSQVSEVMTTMLPAVKTRLMRAINWLLEHDHPDDCPCRKDREESVFKLDHQQ